MPTDIAKAAVLRVTPVSPVAYVQPAVLTVTPVSPGAVLTPIPKTAAEIAVGRAVATQVVVAGQPQVDSNMGHIARGWAFENQDVTTVARVMLPNGAALTQSDVSSVTRNIFNLSTQSNASVQSATLTTGDVVFNALQVDGYWAADTTGYNFRDRATYFNNVTDGGESYRIEYEFNTSSFGDIFVVSEVVIRPMYRA